MSLLLASQAASFLAAAVVVTVSPGPDNLMVLSMGASKGRRYGVAFGMGAGLGCLSHTILASCGVSAVVASSPLAFGVLRLIGGAYLVWLGISALRSKGSMLEPSVGGGIKTGIRGLFMKGLLANAINPKVILFFLAFLPQFVDASRGGLVWQIAQLGILFTLQASLLFGCLGWFAGHIGKWLQRSAAAGRWLDRIAGAVFVLIGVRLLVS